MKRTLTGIAAAAVTLGAVAPMAFASTGANGWQYKVATPLPIVVNGTAVSAPYELTAQDSGNTTGYFPVFYFNQALSKLGNGYSASWDGVTHTWAVNAPGVDASKISIAGGVGTGNTTITVNGTVVKKINTGAAKDPAGGGMTTYFPAFYINEIFNSIGAKVSFSGQTGLNISGGQSTTTGSSLSNITVSGESSGSGSSASPAVSLTGKGITVSSTLTDANGNPVANTAVQFQVSEYGTKPNNMPLPTVTDANGTVISGTSNSDNEAYTAYTNSNGVASLTLAGPAGQTYAYEVVAAAPYQNSGATVMSKPAYAEFVANNQAAITPFANSNNAFGATLGKSVPITVALPPNSDGSPRANVLVTLTASNNGYFTNSAGADLGQTVQVSTNASGIAQAWLNDSNSQTVEVSATLPAGIGLNNPESTYISFAQSGIASRVNNYSISSTSLQAGQDVTVAGQLVDASGNPVANGQILVVGNDAKNGSNGSDNNGSFGYVTTSNGKSTVTDFPDIGLVNNGAVAAAQGTSASSTAGDVVTADSNGNFSFVVTDTGDDEAATFSIYAVSNGEVASSSALKSDTIDFTKGTSLNSIALGATDAQATGNTYTSLTGLSAADNTNLPIFVDPQNAAGNSIANQSFNYNLSVDNGGTITGIETADGKSVLPINSANPGLSTAVVQVTYNSSSNDYTFSVPGQSGSITGSSPDFGVDVYNSGTGDTTLSISSGSVSSTAKVNFNGSSPTYAQSVSPTTSNLVAGQSENLTYQVQDNQGNPVPNTEVALYTNDSSDPLWITKVNGVAITQSEQIGTTGNSGTFATPIPLGTSTYSNLGYKSGVDVPGVVSWSGTTGSTPDLINVYTDSNGNVSLTLQNGGVSYYNTSGATSSSTTAGTSSSENFWTYDSDSSATNTDLSTYGQFVIGTAPSDFTQNLGTITLTANNSGGGAVSGKGTVGFTNPQPTSGHSTINAVYGGTYDLTQSSGVNGGTWSATNPSGNTASKVTFGSDANGETATFGSDSTAGQYTFTYSLNGAKEATGTETLKAGPEAGVDVSSVIGGATISSVSTQSASNSQTLSGVAANSQYALEIQAVDAAGNPISGQSFSASVTSGGGTATVNGSVLTYKSGATGNTDTITITSGSFKDTITTNAY